MARLAYVLTGDAGRADEIVQDAFLKVHARWDRIDNPIAYLRTAVVNGCRVAPSPRRHRATPSARARRRRLARGRRAERRPRHPPPALPRRPRPQVLLRPRRRRGRDRAAHPPGHRPHPPTAGARPAAQGAPTVNQSSRSPVSRRALRDHYRRRADELTLSQMSWDDVLADRGRKLHGEQPQPPRSLARRRQRRHPRGRRPPPAAVAMLSGDGELIAGSQRPTNPARRRPRRPSRRRRALRVLHADDRGCCRHHGCRRSRRRRSPPHRLTPTVRSSRVRPTRRCLPTPQRRSFPTTCASTACPYRRRRPPAIASSITRRGPEWTASRSTRCGRAAPTAPSRRRRSP